MSQLELNFEWLDAEGAKGPELRASWARLDIAIDGDYVSCFIDHNVRSARTSIFLPLYPLAEWIATHWWFLFHEVESLGRSTSPSYAWRHDLRHGSEGFALPSLIIQPLGELVRLSWQPLKLPAQSIEFTGTGTAYSSAGDLRSSLSKFVSAVTKRLEEQGVGDTLLAQEWREIEQAGPEESEFCEAVASLGHDPYALDPATQQRILDTSESLPESLLREFFAVADLDNLPTQAQQVLAAVDRSRANQVNLQPLKDLKGEIRLPEHEEPLPWRQGYYFARHFREVLGLNGRVLNSLGELSTALGVPPVDLEASIVKTTAFPDSLDALVATNAQDSPGFAVARSRRDEAVRFAFCRALFEYLATPESQPLLVTKARSARQKRNRAFAAEFLVPAHLLGTRLSSQVLGDEEIDDLAVAFGVSPSVIQHQIENHDLAVTVPERDR